MPAGSALNGQNEKHQKTLRMAAAELGPTTVQ